jgi:mono/diheme cytochrome c family protein
LSQDKTNAEDEWLKLALSAAGADQTDIIGYERGPNLLANASFEKAEGNLPADWQVRTYSAKGADVEHAIETRKAYVHSGKSSVKIRSGNGHDTSVYTPVNLKSGTKYALSAWIKTEGVNGGHGALLNIHELQHEAKTKALQKTTDWQKVEIVFDNTQAGPLTVNCLFGGWGQAKGTAWFDDLSLQEVKPIHKKSAEQKEIPGLAKRGEDIFHKHAVASCVRCHKVGNEGGVIGPAMDGIASRKDRAYIYESLINPTAQLAEGFDKLGASPMPPMNILLDEQQLADVMAYLMTLKGN